MMPRCLAKKARVSHFSNHSVLVDQSANLSLTLTFIKFLSSVKISSSMAWISSVWHGNKPWA